MRHAGGGGDGGVLVIRRIAGKVPRRRRRLPGARAGADTVELIEPRGCGGCLVGPVPGGGEFAAEVVFHCQSPASVVLTALPEAVHRFALAEGVHAVLIRGNVPRPDGNMYSGPIPASPTGATVQGWNARAGSFRES